MAEKWVKSARNEVKLVDNLCVETSKSLTTVESKNKELGLKLAAAERDRKCANASLKISKAQAEEQRKKLHYIEIELARAK